MSECDFPLSTAVIQHQLDSLACDCPQIKAAIIRAGYPRERRYTDQSAFAALLRIVAGQQLSVKAAAAIWSRVERLMGDVTPKRYLELSENELRAAGCSRPKAIYGRHLSEAFLSGALNPDLFPAMNDQDILDSITAVKGFGRWSAEMYMIFALGRTNVWPVGDLAVRKGVGQILALSEAPSQKEMDVLGQRWQPYRSSVALLCWHYYANVPL